MWFFLNHRISKGIGSIRLAEFEKMKLSGWVIHIKDLIINQTSVIELSDMLIWYSVENMEAKMRVQDQIVTNSPTDAKDTNNCSTASSLNNGQGKLTFIS